MPDGGLHFDAERYSAAMADLRAIVAPARWVKQEKFEAMTGFSKGAQRHKMDSGVWEVWTTEKPTGIWKLAPDGNRLVNLDNYYRWVEGG